MTRTLTTAMVAVAALAAPASAQAGGFATVGLDSLPEGAAPDTPWRVELTVLQHGRTPLEGVRPRVIVTRGDLSRTFPARPTRRPGVYRAVVLFPSPGKWQYVVDDGFGVEHSFAPVHVGRRGGEQAAHVAQRAHRQSGGGGSGASERGPNFLLALAAAAVAGVAAGLGTAALARRRRPPAPEGG